MKTNTFAPDDGTDTTDPSPTTLFKAFSEPRRQYTLQYLVHTPGAVPLGDVAEYIAIVEDEPTYDQYERILVSLIHFHIPHLSEANLVEYDIDQETLELLVDTDTIRPYLQLASLSDPTR